MLYESRRQTLRVLTQAAHAELDTRVGGFNRPADYVGYVRGQHAFRRLIEPILADLPWLAIYEGWQFRPLLPLLSADLADLDAEPAEMPDVRVDILGPQDLLGVLYVLEGSGLGARLLYRRALALGFDAGFGARHLAAQAEDRDSWPRFLTLLESAEPFEMQRAVTASLATFAAAGAAFERPLHVAS